MQIERIAIRLRRRTPQEAIDLGGAMLRAWAPDILRVWFSTYWVFALLLLAVCWHHQTIAMAILWWLKPAFDRILLFVYSRSLFHGKTSVREVLSALPGLARHSGLLSGLTLRRLSLARSFLLPVWQLEHLSGSAARERFQLLSRRTRGSAVWLTILCANFSTVLWISFLIVVEMFRPQETPGLGDFREWFSDDQSPAREFVGGVLFLLAETLVEPLYVASGFALYLNRRSDLEGWDIELAFRRLTARFAGTAAAVLLAFGLALGWPGESAQAAEMGGTTSVSREKQTIEKVLADPVFGKKTREKEWRLRETPANEPPPPEERGWLKSLFHFFDFMGGVLKGLVWIIGGLLLIAFVYLLVVHRERWLPGSRGRVPPPDFLFGLDVRPESLPADPAAAARAALARGQVELALSLLYRGALVALIHRTEVEFRSGDTEGDCRRRVAGRVEPDTGHYFGDLLEAWQNTAYAHNPPPASRLEALCTGWETHFRAVFGTVQA